MLVRDAKSSPAIMVGPEATYHEIVHVLLNNDISGVAVVDDHVAIAP